MAGLGNSPYGLCPIGTGTPADPTAVPTAATYFSRWLDPITGDYQLATTGGQLRQMSGVMQRILILFRTQLGTCQPDPALGVKFPKKQTATFTREVEDEVRRVLRPLTDDERVMEINSIQVTRGGGRFAIDLEYQNLQTGLVETIPTLSVRQ